MIRESGKQWQTQLLPVEPFCDRAHTASVSHVLIHGMPVGRDVVDLHTDASCPQSLENLTPSPVEHTYGKQVPGRINVWTLRGKLESLDAIEEFEVARDKLGSSSLERRQPTQLT